MWGLFPKESFIRPANWSLNRYSPSTSSSSEPPEGTSRPYRPPPCTAYRYMPALPPIATDRTPCSGRRRRSSSPSHNLRRTCRRWGNPRKPFHMAQSYSRTPDDNRCQGYYLNSGSEHLQGRPSQWSQSIGEQRERVGAWRSGAVCTHRDRHFLADRLTLFSSSCARCWT